MTLCADLSRLATAARAELAVLAAEPAASATARAAAAGGSVRDGLAGMRRLMRDLELLVEEQDTCAPPPPSSRCSKHVFCARGGCAGGEGGDGG